MRRAWYEVKTWLWLCWPVAPRARRLRKMQVTVAELQGQLGRLTVEVYEQRFALMDMAGVMARAYRKEGRAVPDGIAKFAPAPAPEPGPGRHLRVLPGGAR